MSIAKLFVAVTISLVFGFAGSMVFADGNTTSASGLVEATEDNNTSAYPRGNSDWTYNAAGEVINIVTSTPGAMAVCSGEVTGVKEKGVPGILGIRLIASTNLTELFIPKFNIGAGTIPQCDLFPDNPVGTIKLNEEDTVIKFGITINVHAHTQGDCDIGTFALGFLDVRIAHMNNKDGMGIPPDLSIDNFQCVQTE